MRYNPDAISAIVIVSSGIEPILKSSNIVIDLSFHFLLERCFIYLSSIFILLYLYVLHSSFLIIVAFLLKAFFYGCFGKTYLEVLLTPLALSALVSVLGPLSFCNYGCSLPGRRRSDRI